MGQPPPNDPWPEWPLYLWALGTPAVLIPAFLLMMWLSP